MKHSKLVLLYAISRYPGPKLIVEISKPNWEPRIKGWIEKGLNLEFLIVEK